MFLCAPFNVLSDCFRSTTTRDNLTMISLLYEPNIFLAQMTELNYPSILCCPIVDENANKYDTLVEHTNYWILHLHQVAWREFFTFRILTDNSITQCAHGYSNLTNCSTSKTTTIQIIHNNLFFTLTAALSLYHSTNFKYWKLSWCTTRKSIILHFRHTEPRLHQVNFETR